jgi:hypothetical protein
MDNTGKLSILEDRNGDDGFEDPGEITHILNHLPGYNILRQFNPGRDEVVGIGDVLVLDDGRVFFTLDDNFETITISELSADFEHLRQCTEFGDPRWRVEDDCLVW